jgi:hypothetical protein
MMPRRPPRLADWLLHRLASGPRRHSLVGDLHEQHSRGRSAAWYWRQTVTAILAGIASDLRRHPADMAHALCTGLGAWVLYSMLIVGPAWGLFERVMLDYQWMRRSAVIPWAWLPLELIGGWVDGRCCDFTATGLPPRYCSSSWLKRLPNCPGSFLSRPMRGDTPTTGLNCGGRSPISQLQLWESSWAG